MKTEDLIGAALDWAVAKCESRPYPCADSDDNLYSPSTSWSQGGQIIESEKMWLNHSPADWDHDPEWTAKAYPYDDERISGFGETPLIAAMRCYVAIKLGDEIEVPKELW